MATNLAQPPQTVYRDGDKLEVPRGASLPPYCVKCGMPSAGDPIPKTFFWHHPMLFLLVLFNLLIYAIVAMIVRKRFDLAVPLCEAHKASRKTTTWVGLLLLVAGIPGALIIGSLFGGDDGIAWALLLSIVLLVAGLLVLAMGRRMLIPKRIEPTRAIFAGAGDIFLNMLPTKPDSMLPGSPAT
jgi:hypothetical protein